jgi:hypothetical protein
MLMNYICKIGGRFRYCTSIREDQPDKGEVTISILCRFRLESGYSFWLVKNRAESCYEIVIRYQRDLLNSSLDIVTSPRKVWSTRCRIRGRSPRGLINAVHRYYDRKHVGLDKYPSKLRVILWIKETLKHEKWDGVLWPS